MTTNQLILVIACVMGALGLLRAVAPAVARRWPGSILDQTIAFLLRAGSDWLGAVFSLALRQGVSGALVPTSDEAAMAQRAYEAYAIAVRWTTYTGDTMKPWADLPEDAKVGWVAIVKAIHLGQKAAALMIVVFVAAGCGATKTEALIKSVSDLDPKLHAAYRMNRDACVVISPDDAKLSACLAQIDAAWAPIESVMTEIHALWCEIVPGNEGCK